MERRDRKHKGKKRSRPIPHRSISCVRHLAIPNESKTLGSKRGKKMRKSVRSRFCLPEQELREELQRKKKRM